ncbi:hypothetical protein OJAV_G00020910 [Oryzias javanicus]|uniref:Uncharacterized protein n=1 Tax=Oryzias javanicus TaxID=123683 RepID=A0A3S2UMN3_ORYJA|nr:hypothetical protein OJAV_G00020910 [Oryzias javanicus]
MNKLMFGFPCSCGVSSLPSGVVFLVKGGSGDAAQRLPPASPSRSHPLFFKPVVSAACNIYADLRDLFIFFRECPRLRKPSKAMKSCLWKTGGGGQEETRGAEITDTMNVVGMETVGGGVTRVGVVETIAGSSTGKTETEVGGMEVSTTRVTTSISRGSIMIATDFCFCRLQVMTVFVQQ